MWISVNKDLPSGNWTTYKKWSHLSEDVLIWNGLDYFIGRYNRIHFEWETDEPIDRNTIYDVTHWMPLPPKP